MKNKSRIRSALDILYISMIILPIITGIVLKVLTTPKTEGIDLKGARIFFTVPMPFQDLPITETQINSWLVIISLLGLCLFLTRGLKTRNIGIRQHIAEWIVEKTEGLTLGSMGEYFSKFSPFIAAILGLSGFSSLLSLFGMYPPTSDLNTTAGWAILVFFLITYYKLKCGPLFYLKGLTEPVIFLTPMNIIGELATPFSMAFRHYGNVLSGSIISVLVAAGLQGLSSIIFRLLPSSIGDIPFLQIGLPAILSIYFDIFSGLLQAYIFAMLTMMYISNGFPMEEYFIKKSKQKNKI